MEEHIPAIIMRHYGCGTDRIIPLGGGFYGRVFLAEIPREPYKVVLKMYLYPGIARNEALQLKTLAVHATVRMPNVYWVDSADEEIPNDTLAMEYIPGVNAGKLEKLPAASLDKIADQITDNLLAYHKASHDGFGPLDAQAFAADWRDYYRPIAEAVGEKAQKLLQRGALDENTAAVIGKALSRYNQVFHLPITDARLIHGDYNTWNVILTEDMGEVRAVIDPFNCCWADPEYDLYQLDNANGKEFRLLERYFEKAAPSENFTLKKAFYELFTELNHYYDANVPISYSNIPQQAVTLLERMRSYGIVL